MTDRLRKLIAELGEAKDLEKLSNRELCDRYFKTTTPDLVVAEMIKRLCPEFFEEPK